MDNDFKGDKAANNMKRKISGSFKIKSSQQPFDWCVPANQCSGTIEIVISRI